MNAEVDFVWPGGQAAREVENDVLRFDARAQSFQRVGKLQHRDVGDSDQHRYGPGRKI